MEDEEWNIKSAPEYCLRQDSCVLEASRAFEHVQVMCLTENTRLSRGVHIYVTCHFQNLCLEHRLGMEISTDKVNVSQDVEIGNTKGFQILK